MNGSEMETWLVLSNCHSLGLANCLQLQYPHVHIVAIEQAAAMKEPARVLQESRSAARIFISPPVKSLNLIDASKPTIDVPSFSFAGYHPDLSYVKFGEEMVQSPLHDYHSTICFAAFKKGYSETDTKALFVGRNYERCGYFAVWEQDRDLLEHYLQQFQIDGCKLFRRWTMRGPFMYSTNHPRIECLFDIATELLRSHGLEPTATSICPLDNLINGPIFPIFDEIAESLGVQGSYLFKPTLSYSLLTLDEFIGGSFAVYRRYDPQKLQPHPESKSRFSSVFNCL